MRISCLLTTGLLVVSVMAQPTARQWNSEVTAGWNLGNQLECTPQSVDNESTLIDNPTGSMQSETAWGNPVVTRQMFQSVRDAGFNAVRIPIRWQHHITDVTTMTIDEQWMQRVRQVVDDAIACDLKVIINTHHDKWLESRPYTSYKALNNSRLRLLWTQIATAFRDYGYELAFAGTNEVHVPNIWNAPTQENLDVQNSYNQTFVSAVRATGGNNSRRHLVVQTYACNANYGLNNNDFIIPSDIDGNGNDYLSVEVHYYSPWEYCGGGNYDYWGTAYSQYGPIPEANEQTMRNELQRMSDIWGAKGLGIVMGEWGVSNHYEGTNVDLIHDNMAYYCKTLVSEALRLCIATFVWDNGAFGNGEEMFGIFNRKNAMACEAEWTLRGIREGVPSGIRICRNTAEETGKNARKIVFQNCLYIVKGTRKYKLTGSEF